MDEPWNLKKEDSRKPDSLPNFIIFCEDEVSEPIYLKFFETPLIKVNPIKKQHSKIDNVLKAITYCTRIGLLDSSPKLPGFEGNNAHVWCVFDRDIESDPDDILLGNTKFDESIKMATSNELKVAWSNDSFELWILLHFDEIDPTDERYKNRSNYYERLTEIYKSMELPNEDLAKALSHGSFSYKRDCKSDNNFRNIVRSSIVRNTAIAIKRSRELETYFENFDNSHHDKSPCTLVHHLVEELLEYGKKQIES